MTSCFSSCKKGIRAGRCKESRIHHTGNLKLNPVFQNPAKLTLSKIHVHKKSCMHLSAVLNLQVLHLLVLTHTHTDYSQYVPGRLPACTHRAALTLTAGCCRIQFGGGRFSPPDAPDMFVTKQGCKRSPAQLPLHDAMLL